MDEKTKWIKKIYLYSFSMLGLILLIIGSVQIIDIGLKTLIFTKADIVVIPPQPIITNTNQKGNEKIIPPNKEETIKYQKNDAKSRNQRQASNAIAMIIVGLPLFLYHWNLAKKEK